MNMLEHQIAVLKNVSHNRDLFRKELMKSKRWLSDDEFELLKLQLVQTDHNIEVIDGLLGSMVA